MSCICWQHIYRMLYARNTHQPNKITNEAAQNDVFEDNFRMIGLFCVCVCWTGFFVWVLYAAPIFQVGFCVVLLFLFAHPPSFKLQKNCDLSNIFHWCCQCWNVWHIWITSANLPFIPRIKFITINFRLIPVCKWPRIVLIQCMRVSARVCFAPDRSYRFDGRSSYASTTYFLILNTFLCLFCPLKYVSMHCMHGAHPYFKLYVQKRNTPKRRTERAFFLYEMWAFLPGTANLHGASSTLHNRKT